MPEVQGYMHTFNSPQYAGELFTADPTNTPLLSMIGGMTGGLSTKNDEFPTAILYDYPAPKQPEISEKDSVTAPDPTFLTREQEKNVVQIFHEAIQITYLRRSNSARMEGINVANDTPNPSDELSWQIEQRLKKVARDIEHTFINGEYLLRNSESQANKTRGMLELSTVTDIDAAGAKLDKALLNSFYKELVDNGAYLDNMVTFVNSGLKQELTEIYNAQLGFNLPATRQVGGLNITTIETDFFTTGIVFNKFMPQNTLLLADVAHIAPVFQTVPDKGNFFLEELAKTGASERYQLYGQIGLAHGPAFLHGTIRNLDVS